MEKRDWRENYLNQVREQIHWKRAQPVVLRELRDHLQDQRDAYLSQGMKETDAETEALRQMGDPVTVGRELNQLHRPKPAWGLLVAMTVLAAVGLALWRFLYYDGDAHSWLPLLSMGLAAGLCALTWHTDMNRLAERAHWLCAALVLGMLTMALNQRFLIAGTLYGREQYLALLSPLAFAGTVYALRDRGWLSLALYGAVFCLLLALCWGTGNFCSVLIFVISACVIMLQAISPGKKRGWRAGILLAIVLLLALAWHRFSVMERILHDGFLRQMVQAAWANSKPLGMGTPCVLSGYDFTMTPQQMMDSSFMQCDFFLAAMAYRCGWLTALTLLAAVGGFLLLCLRGILRQKTLWGKLLACAVVTPLLVQTCGHVLANFGVIVSSFELPLLSYGNTYRMIDGFLLGLLLAVLRSGSILRDVPSRLAALR